MATPQGLKKPVFSKVENLKPGQSERLNLRAKVEKSTVVLDKTRVDGNKIRVAEVILGDETASIILTARNEQIDLLKPGSVVEVRNVKVEMFNDAFMRVVVDKWGKIISSSEPANFNVNLDNNLSSVEYERQD
jgi:replication factor A1